MTKKKTIGAEDITEKEILSFYTGVLPLLYDNSENIDPIAQIIKKVKQFVDFDSYHYVMDDPEPPLPEEKFLASFIRPLDSGSTNNFESITVRALKNTSITKSFEDQCLERYEAMLSEGLQHFPDKPLYYYHEISSKQYPKLSLGFFRFSMFGDKEGAFTKDEKLIIKKLSPHIFLLCKTSLSPLFRNNSYRSVDSNIDICSSIANEFKLSDAEVKLLPEILFGYSNEEIGKKNFVSTATVKTHIQHIFKKTGVKNRLDFISKFFTSPERIEL